MEDPLAQALAALKEKTGDAPSDTAVRFDFEDLGALRLDAQGARMDDGSPADVTISADLATFKALFDGEINPTAAYMSGKIRIDGDMSAAMKVASLLG